MTLPQWTSWISDSYQWLSARKWIMYSLLALVLIGGAWYLWAPSKSADGITLTVHLKPFSETVSVAGTVQSANTADLSFPQSGRVSSINYEVGEYVSAGSIIASIDNGDLSALRDAKVAALQQQQAKLEALNAGTRPEDIAVAQAQVESDTTALAQSLQTSVNAIADAYTKADDAIHNQTDPIYTNPRTPSISLIPTINNSILQGTVLASRPPLEQVFSDWSAHIQPLPQDNALTVAEVEAAEADAITRLTSFQQYLANVSTLLSQAIPTNAASQTQINQWISATTLSRTNIQNAIAAITSARTAHRAGSSLLEKDTRALALKKAGPTTADIAAQQAVINAALADLQNTRAQLGKTVVYAPFSGVITRMDIEEGEIANPTTAPITLMSNGTYQIETYISELTIASVQPGQMATTTLDAYGAEVTFPAKVVSVDPARTIKDGVTTYKTILEFLKKDDRIRSGMTTTVAITTGTKAHALVIPLSALSETGTSTTVRIKQQEGARVIPVTLGSRTLTEIEILSGLREGDVVYINPAQ